MSTLKQMYQKLSFAEENVRVLRVLRESACVCVCVWKESQAQKTEQTQGLHLVNEAEAIITALDLSITGAGTDDTQC